MQYNTVTLNTSDYPGKYKIYCWSPECEECYNSQMVILDEWSNAGSYYMADGSPEMQGGYKGYEVQCENCGNKQTEPEYFYTNDERAAALLVSGDDTQPIH